MGTRQAGAGKRQTMTRAILPSLPSTGAWAATSPPGSSPGFTSSRIGRRITRQAFVFGRCSAFQTHGRTPRRRNSSKSTSIHRILLESGFLGPVPTESLSRHRLATPDSELLPRRSQPFRRRRRGNGSAIHRDRTAVYKGSDSARREHRRVDCQPSRPEEYRNAEASATGSYSRE